jgi:hypothetical protein
MPHSSSYFLEEKMATDRYQILRTPELVQMVRDLMRKRRFSTYSELFRAVIREAWEKYCGMGNRVENHTP